MRTYKTEGIILKRTNFGEADRLLTIFSKHYGKIKARAPGVRRIISTKSTHLEVFNYSSLFLIEGRNLDIVTEAQTIDNFPGIRKNLNKIGIAYFFCELIDNLCPERQENREVFTLLKRQLKNLEQNCFEDLYSFRENFANQLLKFLGFLPPEKKLEGKELKTYLEKIIEKKLKSLLIFEKIKLRP